MLLLGFFYLTRYLNVYIPINFYLFTRRPNSLFGGSAGGRGGDRPLGWGGPCWASRGGRRRSGGFQPKDSLLGGVLSPVLSSLPQLLLGAQGVNLRATERGG